MNQNSRTSNVVRNLIGGVGGQLFTSILSFVCRTYFIKYLGATYLGVNGLFANILSLLSLAELGIGPAIVFSMYKPIKDNDEEHVARLMNFYKKAYRIIAVIVTVCGLALLPFLPYLIKDTTGIDNLRLIFVLILTNTSVSYLFAYKGSMLNADQKSYICVIFRNIFAVVQNIVQILLLIWTGNFLLYLIVQIITTFMANFVQAIYVDKKYPFLVKYKNSKIDKEEQQGIMKNVKGMMMHKVGGFVLNGTDNLVISKFVGIVAVGIYSNYLMIINLVKGYLKQITGSISASVGNFIAKESKEKSYSIYNIVMFGHYWICGFCAVCFYVLFSPFIELWLGGEYLLTKPVLLVIIMNFYLYAVHAGNDTFINASGLFWETKFKPIIESLVNLVVSIVLAYYIGLAGVFIGSVIAYLSTGWIEPRFLYKKLFEKNFILYLIKFFFFFFFTFGIAVGLEIGTTYLVGGALILQVLIRAVLVVLVYNIAVVAISWRSEEFKALLRYGKNFISKIGRRKKKWN